MCSFTDGSDMSVIIVLIIYIYICICITMSLYNTILFIRFGHRVTYGSHRVVSRWRGMSGAAGVPV